MAAALYINLNQSQKRLWFQKKKRDSLVCSLIIIQIVILAISSENITTQTDCNNNQSYPLSSFWFLKSLASPETWGTGCYPFKAKARSVNSLIINHTTHNFQSLKKKKYHLVAIQTIQNILTIRSDVVRSAAFTKNQPIRRKAISEWYNPLYSSSAHK